MLALPPLTFTEGFPFSSPTVPYQPAVEKNDLKSSPSCFRLVKDGYILKDAIFVTSPGDGAQLRLKNGRGKIFVELKDDEIHQKKDGVTLYLETSGRNYAAPYSSAYKVWSSADGSRVRMWRGHRGEWREIAVSGIIVAGKSTAEGYSMEIRVDEIRDVNRCEMKNFMKN